MDKKDLRERLEAAWPLFQKKSTNKEKFESIRTLVKGINPRLDKALEKCSKALIDVERLQKGEVIELAADHLPEKTEEEKKKKKTVILFIKTWKDLQAEVKRVRTEFENMQHSTSTEEQALTFSKIIAKAKGPLGGITLAAIVIVVAMTMLKTLSTNQTQEKVMNSSNVISETSNKKTIKVIEVNDQRIPLSEVKVGRGRECDGDEHYHALNGISVRSLDAITLPDPGGCGYGKVRDVKVITVPFGLPETFAPSSL